MPSIPVPEELKPYGVLGIFVGGCVERGDGSSFRASAHAHNAKYKEGEPFEYMNKYTGWVCVRSAKRLYNPAGQISALLWHETAHIRRRSWTEKQCDDWAWQQVRQVWQQTLMGRWHKKVRNIGKKKGGR